MGRKRNTTPFWNYADKTTGIKVKTLAIVIRQTQILNSLSTMITGTDFIIGESYDNFIDRYLFPLGDIIILIKELGIKSEWIKSLQLMRLHKAPKLMDKLEKILLILTLI